jgi:Holliday junction resolvase RusA-like endonuclease
MKRAAPAALFSFFLAASPSPASRPIVTRWSTHYSKGYERFRAEALPLAEAFDGVPTDQPIVVMIEAIVEKPKHGKLKHPRGDVDNFAKGPLDTLEKAKKFWVNDGQAVGLLAFKRYAEPGEKPGFVVNWFLMEED